MGIFTKDIKSMDDLLIHGLQDIYYAEQQIIKSLPKMIDKVTNRDLAGRNVRRSTESSRRPTRSLARSRTRPYSMQPSSPPLRPSSTTRSAATGR